MGKQGPEKKHHWVRNTLIRTVGAGALFEVALPAITTDTGAQIGERVVGGVAMALLLVTGLGLGAVGAFLRKGTKLTETVTGGVQNAGKRVRRDVGKVIGMDDPSDLIEY